MGEPKPLEYLETAIAEELAAGHARRSWQAQQEARKKAEEMRQEMVRRGEIAKKAAERAVLLTEATQVVFQWIQRTVPHHTPLQAEWTDDVIGELRRQGASDALIRDAIAMAIASGYGFTATFTSERAGILAPPSPESRPSRPWSMSTDSMGGRAEADAGLLRIKAERLEVEYLEARRTGDQKGMQVAVEKFVGLLNQAKTVGDQNAAKDAASELAKAIETAPGTSDSNAPADGRERVGGAPLEVPPSHQAPPPRRVPIPQPDRDLPRPGPLPRGPYR